MTRLPRTEPQQPVRRTEWAPKVEKLHKAAQEKLGSSRDVQMVSQRDLELPQTQ